MKKFISKSIIVLAAFSNITYAGIYLKGYFGNTENSFNYQVNRYITDTTGPAIVGITEDKVPSSSNLFSAGGAFGIDRTSWFNPNVKLGVELNLERQFDHTKFTINNGNVETALLDLDISVLDITNEAQGAISLVTTLYNTFYVKVGGALLSQKVDDTVYQSNNPRLTAALSKSTTKTHYGVNLASGLTYQLTKSLSVFSEYNVTFFNKKTLHKFTYDDDTIVVNGANDLSVSQFDKKIKVDHSKFFIGFKLNTDQYDYMFNMVNWNDVF